METTQSQPLTLSFNEASGEVTAHFDPSGGFSPPDRPDIRSIVNERGWHNFYMEDKVIDAFIDACRGAKNPVEMVIASRRDGDVSIRVAEDSMTAWMTLVPAYGGRPATQAELLELLSSEGITHGIRHEDIKAAFAAGVCERLVIAAGDPAQEGQPTRFETLYDKQEENAEEEEEEDLDRVKYTDLCHILLVQTGQPVMRRHPPVQGKPGTNIKGNPLPPHPTPDVAFNAQLRGVELHKEDRNLMLATTGGQPVRVGNNGVMVNPVIELLNVDLGTGSVEFDGTLHVGGDIKAGLRVKVSGDVIVGGTMEAAEVIAGGNVAIRRGVIGHPDATPGAQGLPDTTARIICDGFVQALFMECAHIEAGKSIHIERSARQCELIARDEVIVGKDGGKNGQLMGGRTEATNRIAVGTLGMPTGVRTYVQVGVDPYLEQQIEDKDNEFKRRCGELDNVIKLIAFIKQNPAKGAGGIAEKAEATRKQLLAAIEKLTAELKELRAKLELAEQAEIEVNSTMCFGVEVRIGQQFVHIREESSGHALIQLKNGKILVGR